MTDDRRFFAVAFFDARVTFNVRVFCTCFVVGVFVQVTSTRYAEAALVRTLMTIPCIGYGVGMTCRSILAGAIAAGYRADLSTTRYDSDSRVNIPVHSLLPQFTRNMPYARIKGLADSFLHARYLASLRDGDIAYLWPSVPLAVFAAIKKRRIPIIAEAVNTRMAVAKPILDAAYAGLGLEPNHGITDDRVREQTARYALCDGIFVPSPATEAAMIGSPLEGKTIAASYGTWLPAANDLSSLKSPDSPVTFLFVGSVCVRKGSHHLLEAWRRMPTSARLRLVGSVEPALARLYQDVLDQENVSIGGFTNDVATEYRSADVFVLPSLEEGDSIVCYEASAYGLPVIASAVGAGRMGAATGSARIINTADVEALAGELMSFAQSGDLRREWGERARRAVQDYDWAKVGPRSFAAMHDFLQRTSD